MVSIGEEVVRVENVSNGVHRLVINRPDHMNALNSDVLQSIILALEKLDKERDVRVIVITGAGEKAFVAGADIGLLNQLGIRACADYIELGQRAMRDIERFRCPIIAAINGYALGGGLELALACDIIVSNRSAKMGLPEVSLGIIPGFGGTQRLALRCGIGIARRLILTGEMINADKAYEYGLVDEVVDDGTLNDAVEGICNQIAKQGPYAVTRAKQLLRESNDSRLLAGLNMEVEAFLDVFNTADREEGMTAFLQKRKPKFSGR